MSSELKRKLYDLELEPHERVWQKIDEALDEELPAEISMQLQELEVMPPVNAWNAIAAELDREENISYPSKLYNLEITPPASTWQSISAALEEEEKLPRIVPIKRRTPVFKYAVAACLIGLIAFGVKWLTAEKVDSTAGIKNLPKQEFKPKQNQAVKEQENPAQPREEPIVALSNNLPKEGKHRKTTPNNFAESFTIDRPTTSVARSVGFQQASFISCEYFEKTCLNRNSPGSQSGFADAADHYLVFENEQGQQFRMSKKLAQFLGCNTMDKSSEEYKKCLEQLKKWREKIANSPITPSPDNFMDIFNLIKADENQF